MSIRIIPTALPEILVIEPDVVGDARGFFYESFNARDFAAHVQRDVTFVQDNHSQSSRGVLRGLHYQIEHAQGKLVRVIQGEVFDVVVDIRAGSATFGKWTGTRLCAADRRQLWIPPGFAHGFLTLSDSAECLYKTTDYWYAEHERTILWNDPDIGIEWPIDVPPLLSAKDVAGRPLREADLFE